MIPELRNHKGARLVFKAAKEMDDKDALPIRKETVSLLASLVMYHQVPFTPYDVKAKNPFTDFELKYKSLGKATLTEYSVYMADLLSSFKKIELPVVDNIDISWILGLE